MSIPIIGAHTIMLHLRDAGMPQAQTIKSSKKPSPYGRRCPVARTLSIIGVYPSEAEHFPIGDAMNKNLTIKMGNCNHRKYIPKLVDMVQTGQIDPKDILTQQEPLMNAIDGRSVVINLSAPAAVAVTPVGVPGGTTVR